MPPLEDGVIKRRAGIGSRDREVACRIDRSPEAPSLPTQVEGLSRLREGYLSLFEHRTVLFRQSFDGSDPKSNQ